MSEPRPTPRKHKLPTDPAAVPARPPASPRRVSAKKKADAKKPDAQSPDAQGPTPAQDWLDKIERAKKVKEEWQQQFRIILEYDYLEGRQRPPHINARDWMTINKVFSSLRAILPSLYRNDPYFFIKLTRSFKPDPMLIALYEAKALGRQSMLNYLKPQVSLKQKIRLAIFDALFQFAVMKSHTEGDLVENPDKGQPMLDDAGDPLFDDEGNPLKEPALIPVNEEYHVSRVHPDDFLVDEDAGPLEDDISWLAQRIKMRVEKVRKDPRFDKQVRQTIQPTEMTDKTQEDREKRKKGMALQSPQEKAATWVVMWEVYDLEERQWFTVAEGCKEFLVKPDSVPKGVKKHPYSFLRFFLRDNSWYPLPIVSQWLDPQREYSELRSKVMTHRKRFNRKYVVNKNALNVPDPDVELTKLEVGEDGTIVLTNGQAANDVVFPILDAPLDQNHIQELLMLSKDFEELAIGPNQRMQTQGVDSATEAGIIEKRAMIQEGDDIAQVVDFACEIAEKLDAQIQVHLTEDQAVKVEGPDGEETWQLIRAQDYSEIEGEYDYSVDMSQVTQQTPEVERAQFTALMQLFMAAPALGTDKAIVRFICQLYNADDQMMNGVMRVCGAMVAGRLPMPTQMGSAPGSPGLPGTASAGMATGMNNFAGGGLKQ
jgi:hypothetical protein